MLHHVSVGVSNVEGAAGFYGPDYYGAFVLDPNGNRLEAVVVTLEQKEPKPKKKTVKKTKKSDKKTKKAKRKK